jgi:hypothetical protein
MGPFGKIDVEATVGGEIGPFGSFDLEAVELTQEPAGVETQN